MYLKDNNIEIDLKNIGDHETLARVIFAPSMLMGDSIAPSAFNLVRLPSGKDEDYVSVNRIDNCILRRECVANIRPRTEGDSVCGYAEMTAGRVRKVKTESISVSVMPKPSKNNRFHAGIFYTQDCQLIKGHCTSVEFLIVTTMLAKLSVYRAFGK